MQSLPKFALHRLREPAPALTDTHPDADLLTAFAEQSLPGHERARVLEHLAACSDCRDVVALALPATEISPTLASSPARIGWLTWPTLRWAAAAAVVIAVTSVGVVQYSHRRDHDQAQEKDREQTIASNSAPADSPAPASSASPSAQKSQPSPQVTTSPAQRKQLREPLAPAVRSFRSNAHQQLPQLGGTPQSTQPDNSAAARAQNAIPRSSQQVMVSGNPQTVPVESAASTIETETAGTQLAQNRANLPLQGRNFTSLDVVKAKDPVPTPASSAPPVASPTLPLQTSPSMMLRASPRWMVTSAGALQRSFDGGITWESVEPSRTIETTTVAVTAAASPAPVATGADETQQNKNARAAASSSPTPPIPNATFRAVAANGLEVWAGGAALYHSSDGGNRWARIVPTDSVSTLTGDIIAIQFSDSQNGEVRTSTGERWITSNAGLSWRRPQ